MRKIAFVGLLVGLFSLSALAAENDHPKAEFFGGYQYTRLEGGVNANGFDLGVTGNFNNYFGITADFGSSYTTQQGVSFNNYTYTFGPQLSLRANKGWTPFVHVFHLPGLDRAVPVWSCSFSFGVHRIDDPHNDSADQQRPSDDDDILEMLADHLREKERRNRGDEECD